jgi:hypothetical protein
MRFRRNFVSFDSKKKKLAETLIANVILWFTLHPKSCRNKNILRLKRKYFIYYAGCKIVGELKNFPKVVVCFADASRNIFAGKTPAADASFKLNAISIATKRKLQTYFTIILVVEDFRIQFNFLNFSLQFQERER